MHVTRKKSKTVFEPETKKKYKLYEARTYTNQNHV